jgi:hypothetical protein
VTIDVAGKTIRDIEIIDDRDEVRESMAYAVEELRLNPIKYEGPIWDLDDFIRMTLNTTQAAICDHHLRVRDYSPVNGSEIVARLYQNKFPALLCTRWEAADINDMRPLRRYIPVLVSPDGLTPDTIIDGIRQCVDEFHGEFREERRPWRTLVRIEDIMRDDNGDFFYFFVPAWDAQTGFRLPLLAIPEVLRKSGKSPHRLHALVNLGADSAEELFFDGWEK